jgi:DNA primase
MDVVALAQHGVEHCVATLGTATSAVHLQKLFRATDEVVFCFDGDAAGRRAAWHALEVALPVLADGKIVRFMFLPAEDDPDSFVRANGDAAFRDMIGRAQALSAYFVEELTSRVDMGSAEGRSKFLAEAKPLVKRIAAPALQLQLVGMLADASGMSSQDVARVLEIRYSGSPVRSRNAPLPTREQQRRAPQGQLETRVLAYLMVSPRLARRLPRDLFDPELPLDGTILAVADFIAEHLSEAQQGRDCGALLLDHFVDAPERLNAIRDAQIWGEAMGFGADEAEAEFGPALDRRRDQLESERQKYLGGLISKGRATAEEEREFAKLSMRSRPAPEASGDAVTGP